MWDVGALSPHADERIKQNNATLAVCRFICSPLCGFTTSVIDYGSCTTVYDCPEKAGIKALLDRQNL